MPISPDGADYINRANALSKRKRTRTLTPRRHKGIGTLGCVKPKLAAVLFNRRSQAVHFVSSCLRQYFSGDRARRPNTIV